MMLLLPALSWAAVREPVAACADALLQHLSLLFVPVGVGVMTHLALVSEYGLRMLLGDCPVDLHRAGSDGAGIARLVAPTSCAQARGWP